MGQDRSVLVNFVGTPWLSAGNHWPEYYLNGVPFDSVLPDLRTFPAYSGARS